MLPLLWSNVSARIDTIQSLDKHIEIIHTNTCTIHRQVNILPNEKTIFRIRTQTVIKPQLLHFISQSVGVDIVAFSKQHKLKIITKCHTPN